MGLHVAIIGAGVSGLVSAKWVTRSGFTCEVFEMGSELGGTWVYKDENGVDKYGYPIYSAMYSDLRTNLPKEVMGLPDFPLPESNKSYLNRQDILHFLNDYADHFNIRSFIKLNTIVTQVCPSNENKWRVTTVYKPTAEENTKIFDAIMICSGRYNKPLTPKLIGQDRFKGSIEHSQSYRSAEKYRNMRVLLIGAGPSALDLAALISATAAHLVLSHHCKTPITNKFPINVSQKPDVAQINSSEEVEFVDGSCCCFDCIILCTGYECSYPFLDSTCGITIEENFIQPLYKHMIHIEKPTMCFIGMPSHVCLFRMSDLQARYFCKYLEGTLELPTEFEMKRHTEHETMERRQKGYNKRKAHMMGEEQESYYNSLAKDAEIDSIAPVYVKIWNLTEKFLYDQLFDFRDYQYTIVDEQNYIQLE